MHRANSQNDQLSWSDLRDHLAWWVLQIKNFFGFIWDSVKKRPWRFRLLVALGAAFAVFQLFQKAQKYIVRCTYQYEELHPKVFGDMTSKLNALIRDESYNKLAGLLQLTPEEVEYIISIEVTDNRGKKLEQNYSLHREPMIVEIELTDPIEDKRLEKGITDYFNSNPFIASRLGPKIENLKKEKAYIQDNLKKIDTILANYYANRATPLSGITIENSQVEDAYDVLKFSRELIQREQEVDKQLVHPENMYAVDNFIVIPAARFSTGPIIGAAILGIAMGFLISLLWSAWEYAATQLTPKH